MAYGMQVFKQDGSIRLDPGDRQVMHYKYFSGTLAQGNSTTVSVGGGYDITSGDWGIDVTPISDYFKAVSTTNTVTLTLLNGYSAMGSPIYYQVNVFKLNT